MASNEAPEESSEMAPIEAPLDPPPCYCPKWCPLPMCPYHDEMDKPKAIEIIISSEVPIDTTKTPIVWVLGGPGCGKGTQCTKIIERYGFTHLSTGDLLRAEVAKGSESSGFISKLMKEGALVPTEHVLALLKQEIQATAASTPGFLVDGYPRERSQGLAFEDCIASPNAIIFFEVSENTLMQRMLIRAQTSGRFDDNIITIKLRMKTFYEHNPAVMEQYRHKISMIDGESTVDDIFADVVKVIDPIVAALAEN